MPWADQFWMRRFVGADFPSPAAFLDEDWEDLKPERAALERAILD
jgi:hypothetical protein